ncbi:type IV pili methyl-accepting chemotaxis transducer N-terminal domain-containing protein [Pseudoalteromonas sp. C2R02]|uniref:type IV pili methyl-accepting chemotaxis transducer N-terminal domain-containing protein n=1 Tax=Pseudoalteromonas sp. C2R02 TaxID=2841565 RepID=UPI001C0A0619|nr:type IV pili methyl-accepting chemotaxis transducer N-terminal domain-containing protein [Pseudoalteromonas sp. C2R02]MBU2971808.1 type IV pili methyl-accepting chemotaxis transducer N-terminal domain-containing protein [Pseudoalteromonas sp. C2R02]
MKKFLIILISCFAITSFQANASKLTLEQAIDKAGLQRMLSQRIAKNYILIASRINQDKATIELDESAAQFEMNLHQLKAITNNEQSKIALKRLNIEWTHFREYALTEPKRENTPQIVNRSTNLLNLANDLVTALELSSAKKSAVLINISGRQRMLSQRLAMFYLAGFSGFNEESYHQQMRDTANEFSDALRYLIDIQENPAEIITALSDVNDQWTFYQSRFTVKRKGRYVPRVIQVITETMMQNMDDVTQLYKKEEFVNTVFNESIK